VSRYNNVTVCPNGDVNVERSDRVPVKLQLITLIEVHMNNYRSLKIFNHYVSMFILSLEPTLL